MTRRRATVLSVVGLSILAAIVTAVAVTAGRDRATAATLTKPSSGDAAGRQGALPKVALSRVARDLSQPVGLTSPPGDTHRLFVVEKTGRIRIIKDGTLLKRAFLDVHKLISGGSEQGLLSLAFDPEYASNGRFYVFYTNTAGNIRVARYRVSADPNVANAGTRKVLWSVAHSAHANHNGGQLAFGPDGRLYIGVGDGGSEGDPNLYGQNVHVPYAKIWRLNVKVAGAKPRLYAYGLRNPWRFSFDSRTGNLWIGDVGQNRWEEIDFLRAGTKPGVDFGWSHYEGGHVYKPQAINRARLVFPVAQYSHALGCAVIGGYVYRGSAIPALRGDYVFGDLCSGRIWIKTSPHATKQILTGVSQKLSQITSFGQNAHGELYVMTVAGGLYKLVP